MTDKERESETVKTYLCWVHKRGTSLIGQNKDNTEKKSEVDRERKREKKEQRKELCTHQGLAMPEILGFPVL